MLEQRQELALEVDAGGLRPPLILEIMMMATRRNDEDDNAIRRHSI